LFGRGAAGEVGAQMKIMGKKKALLVTDEGVVKAGIVKQVEKHVSSVGCSYVTFSKVRANPDTDNVEQALTILRDDKDIDIIISVGGGSCHDCAKAVALVATNGGTVYDYVGADLSRKPMMDMIAVNTTAGTGSDMSRFSIIKDKKSGAKMVICDWHITPTVSINDPLLMCTMPPALTATTGIDALCHAVEAYVCTVRSPITDTCALKAIELIAKNLRQSVANGKDLEARTNMCYAQYLAQMAANSAGIGYVHAMAQALGAYYDLPHGLCVAVLLDKIEDYNVIACPERFVDIARAMGENVNGLPIREAAKKSIFAIKVLLKDTGIPASLKGIGVEKEDLEILVEMTMAEPCRLTNPRQGDNEEVLLLYRNAFEG
jgi:alcohol dehydrogenase